ncbi:hypothetical protein OF83DRAFT_1174050 [Amylostereum chailletii]|nr:hypothetical protein OF83DRAFT_1174050 [Amylostereum chailletii]
MIAWVKCMKVLLYFIDKPSPQDQKVLPNPPPPSDLHIREKAVITFTASYIDRYLPFRQHAPTMRKVTAHLESLGANADVWLKSPVGLWNMVVVRTITIGTGFLFDYGCGFRNSDHLFQVKREAEDAGHAGHTEKSYFCNTTIYGNSAGHNINLAKDLWDAVSDSSLSLPWYGLLPGAKPSFKAMFDFFSAHWQDGKRVFSQCGELASLLLAGDYAHTGICNFATVQEMGIIIRKVNAGAISGLRVLGLLPPMPNHAKKPPAPPEGELQMAWSS